MQKLAQVINLEFVRWQKTHLGAELTSVYTSARIKYKARPLKDRLTKTETANVYYADNARLNEAIKAVGGFKLHYPELTYENGDAWHEFCAATIVKYTKSGELQLKHRMGFDIDLLTKAELQYLAVVYSQMTYERKNQKGAK